MQTATASAGQSADEPADNTTKGSPPVIFVIPALLLAGGIIFALHALLARE